MSIRYYIEFTLNGLLQNKPVHPIDGGCSISQDVIDWKERNKFEGKYKFQNIPSESVFDYDLLKQIEVDNPFNRIIFIVQKFINNSWTEIGRGHFVIADCNVDDDRCFYEVTPETEDEYTCIDDIKDKEYNILSEVAPAQPYMVLNPANLEFFTCKKDIAVYTDGSLVNGCPRPVATDFNNQPIHNNVYYGSSLPDNVIGLPYDFPGVNGNIQFSANMNHAYSPLVIYANDCFYSPSFYAYSYFHNINTLNIPQLDLVISLFRIFSNRFTRNDITGLPPNYYNFTVETTWCAESAITLNDPATNAPIPPAGSGWVQSYGMLQGGLPATKWYREAFYNNQMYEFYLKENHCTDFTWELINPYSGDPAGHLNIYRGRELNEVIQMFLDKADCGLTLKSKFLQDLINPVTGERNAFYCLNDGSDCKGPIASDPAIWNFTTFDKLLKNLQVALKLNWIIEGNDFIIEHIKYFENGRNYTLNQNAITDLRGVINHMSDKPEIIRTNKYTYDKSNIYRSEKVSETNYIDFDFSPVTIDYDLQIGKPDSIKTENIDYIFDFAGIYNNPSNFSNNDVVMVAYRVEVIDPSTGQTARVVINESGYRTNEEVTNGFLCLSNLFDRFWRRQRILLNGEMNDKDEVFETAIGKIVQTVSLKDCDLKYLSNSWFITNLGTGRKISAKHNIQLSVTELTILI